MDRIKTADELFTRGFNCAQALLAAFGTDLGLSRDVALKIGTPFGGGMGRTGGMCGAVTGAVMIIGLRYGVTEPNFENKSKINKIVSAFFEQFKDRNKTRSLLCSELVGFSMDGKKKLNQKERDIIESRCPGFVRDAAKLIDEILS